MAQDPTRHTVKWRTKRGMDSRIESIILGEKKEEVPVDPLHHSSLWIHYHLMMAGEHELTLWQMNYEVLTEVELTGPLRWRCTSFFGSERRDRNCGGDLLWGRRTSLQIRVWFSRTDSPAPSIRSRECPSLLNKYEMRFSIRIHSLAGWKQSWQLFKDRAPHIPWSLRPSSFEAHTWKTIMTKYLGWYECRYSYEDTDWQSWWVPELRRSASDNRQVPAGKVHCILDESPAGGTHPSA